jgi:hypothetical protein
LQRLPCQSDEIRGDVDADHLCAPVGKDIRVLASATPEVKNNPFAHIAQKAVGVLTAIVIVGWRSM